MDWIHWRMWTSCRGLQWAAALQSGVWQSFAARPWTQHFAPFKFWRRKSLIDEWWITCWQTMVRAAPSDAAAAEIKVITPHYRAALRHLLSLHWTLPLSAHSFAFLPTNPSSSLSAVISNTHTHSRQQDTITVPWTQSNFRRLQNKEVNIKKEGISSGNCEYVGWRIVVVVVCLPGWI